MSRLRIALPPLRELTPDSPLEFARLDRHGQLLEAAHSTVRQLGSTGPASAECFLHPSDTVLTRLPLPPLSAGRLGAAVACAVEAMVLGCRQALQVAHGRRGDDGQVPVGWLAKADLQRLNLALTQHRLKLAGLYPAPYRLALAPQGSISASVEDGHLLVRHGLDHAAVEPMLEDHLEPLALRGSLVHWIGEPAPQGAQPHTAPEQRWSGPVPGWGLQGSPSRAGASTPGWGKALACCALAITVWLLGLNFYAAREAQHGQQLKAQMSAQVRQAFPELPVILNPLQQARQQLAARQGGSGHMPAQSFVPMLQQAGEALPALVGSVQRLSFSNGQLQLELAADSAALAPDQTVQATLAQAGLSAARTDRIWTLNAAPATADIRDQPLEDIDE